MCGWEVGEVGGQGRGIKAEAGRTSCSWLLMGLGRWGGIEGWSSMWYP